MALEDEIKQVKPFSNLAEKVLVNILYTNNYILSEQSKVLKKYDISSAQYNVLRILQGQKGKPIGINEIIERMLDKMSNASRIVDKLEIKDLAVRTNNQKSRRSVNVSITQVGQLLLKEINIEFEDLVACKNLDESEAEILNTLLDKIRE